MPASEHQAKRKIHLVGGGVRYNTEAQWHDKGVGGSMKASRRQLRKLEKARKKRS